MTRVESYIPRKIIFNRTFKYLNSVTKHRKKKKDQFPNNKRPEYRELIVC